MELLAPAKLTLTLRVTGVRDDGYHLIDAEMITLDLADTLEITPADETSLTVVEAATGLPIGLAGDNLVVRALQLAGRTAAVRLVKAIPAGAGLGGGSADAAAVLRWAGVTDLDAAARLGADVPFCVVGGRARVRGIGERVDPLPVVERTLTLLTPPFGVSTPAVYRAWDELGGPSHQRNDLTPAALVVAPELARWRDHLGTATGEEPTLAGSGGTWFVPGAHDVELDGVAGIVARATS
ncbi:MAG: 4-(cytidine 5'-diphospho)-2-C-methyl-D-erythritol kinase [Actinomycetota bacterium]